MKLLLHSHSPFRDILIQVLISHCDLAERNLIRTESSAEDGSPNVVRSKILYVNILRDGTMIESLYHLCTLCGRFTLCYLLSREFVFGRLPTLRQ